jgi:hypothetical protein
VQHLSRKKFVSAFILSLIKARNVQFHLLAEALNDTVKSSSNERRIQHFFQQVNLDYEQLALLLSSLLPRGKVTLCLDRTEWDFGACQVNILVITAYCRGIGLPIYFEMLDNKSGNSSVEDRTKLLQKCIHLLGHKRIEALIGDREFIGEKFYKYLLVNKLNFYLRLRKNQHLLVGGQTHTAESLLKNRNQCFLDNIKISEFYLSVGLKKVKDKQGNEDYLVVLTNTYGHESLEKYRYRWSIEVFFQSIKKRGFQLENTHLKKLDRLKKLFGLVCVAFALCARLGMRHHDKVQKIKLKKNDYPQKSFFRYGIDLLNDIFRKKIAEQKAEIEKLLSFLIRAVIIQQAKYQILVNFVG